ncbi:hypothetical protein [Mycolicibacterium brumae]|uniref:hypothetical protein n=1 Tax=Mycolicibacterium brumae TaxID=85968 RepID=UPI000A4CE692|nr:hypothetical protein [Mycolicibacterium brumae]MCV7194809.1 hypothetical protein [Mycolicibacterium brumae]RWA19771.1 hypothetical protein MBRU_16410 [Mycolicibacterium brumae DSM 44177]UWW09549.1 hypothetical protein L2Z93_002654 [Mycolicibacterium brumae]
MTLQAPAQEPDRRLDGISQPEPIKQSWLTTRLERANTLAFVLFGGLTAFCVYFSM